MTESGSIPSVTVLLPAFNEESALPSVLDDLDEVLDDSYEVLVVDDGSSDKTAAIARRRGVTVLEHGANRGKGAAIQTGLAAAKGEYIVIMDADASYPAVAVPQVVELLDEHDMVRAVRMRSKEEMPFINRLGNVIFDKLLNFTHRLDGTDHLTGLYGLRRQAMLDMKLAAPGFDIEAEIGIKAHARNLRVTSFPIEYLPRLGDKKLKPGRDGVRILRRILELVILTNPLAAFIVPGLVIMAVTIGLSAVLTSGPVETPYFGLGIHSFIVGALGALASFQLIVFGVAAALYQVEIGYRPAQWLLRLSSRRIRIATAAAGLTLAGVGFGWIGGLVVGWIRAGAGDFFDTRSVVLAATTAVLGLQVLSAALFLSIFQGRLLRRTEG